HNSNSLNKQKPPSPLPISPRNESLTYAHNQKRQSLSHNMMTPSQSQVHRVQEHHLPPFLSPPLSHASQSIRENINSGFEELKSIVPSCRGCADSKAIILRKAAHYIQALEAQIQKLKQSSSGSTTPNTSSVTTPPLVSPVMSVKPISSSHIHMHGGINGNQMYAITDFNQRVGEEKKIQQQLEQQKFMGQWQTNRLNPNYLPDTSTTTTTSSSYQPSHQSQNNHHTQTHHQRNLSYPIPLMLKHEIHDQTYK
ncbi:4433_t:CDS:2, partial [Scutellospora calospora]